MNQLYGPSCHHTIDSLPFKCQCLPFYSLSRCTCVHKQISQKYIITFCRKTTNKLQNYVSVPSRIRERIPRVQYVHYNAHALTRLTRPVPLVDQKLLTLLEHQSSHPVFSGDHVTRTLVLCVFCRSLFLLLYFFFWSLCCLFFDVWILIIPLVSSNSS